MKAICNTNSYKVLTFSLAIEKTIVIKICVISSIFCEKCRCLSKAYLFIEMTCFTIITPKRYFLSVKKQTSPVIYSNRL